MYPGRVPYDTYPLDAGDLELGILNMIGTKQNPRTHKDLRSLSLELPVLPYPKRTSLRNSDLAPELHNT